MNDLSYLQYILKTERISWLNLYSIAEVQEFKDEKNQVDFQFDGIFLKYYFLVKSQVVSFSC